jgi:hypothetical protein
VQLEHILAGERVRRLEKNRHAAIQNRAVRVAKRGKLDTPRSGIFSG